MSPLYVYAVADRGARLEGTGLAGEPLEVVEGGDVAAVVGRMGTAPAVGEEALRAHDAVVRAIAARAPAVLPARFGSVARDDGEVRAALDEAAAAYRGALDLVRGREQMTLRVLDGPEAGPVREAPARGEGGPGARYLSARAAQSGAAGVPGLPALLEALRPLVAAESVERHATPPLRASVYHLIARGGSAAYLEALRRAAERTPWLRVVPSGPWPPYAFASGLR
jgi:hypothetical protein